MHGNNNYTLLIPDKELTKLYESLKKIQLKKDDDLISNLLDDLIYVFGSVEYFSEKCKKSFDKLKKGMEKHIKEVIVEEVTSKDPTSSYMSFPSGETTNFNFVYDLDIYIISLKRCFDFLAKLPVSFFIGRNINKDEVYRLDIADFIKTIKEGSTKYNSLSKTIRNDIPQLISIFESRKEYIKDLEHLRDELIHRKPYKQIYFRATVHIKTKSKWEILRWEFLPKSHFYQEHKLFDLSTNHTIITSKEDLEPLIYDSANQMKAFVIEVLAIVLKISNRD